MLQISCFSTLYRELRECFTSSLRVRLFTKFCYIEQVLRSRFLSTRIEPSKPIGLVRQQIYTAHQHSCKPKLFIVQVQPKLVNKHQAKPLRTCLLNSYAKRTPTFFKTHPVRMKCLLTDVAKPLCVFHATCSHLTLGIVDKGFIDQNILISLS